MTDHNNLKRFADAQERDYERALSEIKSGRKTSHWMWYIFPQIRGLGFSDTSRFYAIKSREEAADYLRHEVLGKRLVEISSALLQLQTNDPVSVFGSVDSMKLQSSMTLFAVLEQSHTVFQQVLDKFYGGRKDEKTVELVAEND